MPHSLGTERCPVGFFSSEQVLLLNGMTTVFTRPEIHHALHVQEGAVSIPFEGLSGLLPANMQQHVYLLPHTSMKYSSGEMIRA